MHKLFGMVFLASFVVVSLVTVGLRQVGLPDGYRELGFGWCEGVRCIEHSADAVQLNNTPVPLGWVIAWLGAPCAVQSLGAMWVIAFDYAKVQTMGSGATLRVTDRVQSTVRSTSDPCEERPAMTSSISPNSQRADPNAWGGFDFSPRFRPISPYMTTTRPVLDAVTVQLLAVVGIGGAVLWTVLLTLVSASRVRSGRSLRAGSR
jgi:hypothetical protein